MQPSGPHHYDMTRAYRAALRRLEERFPDIPREERKQITFYLAKVIHHLQVEPLLKVMRVCDEFLDIAGVPKVTSSDTDDWVSLLMIRVGLGLEKSELNLGQMEALHRLLTVFGVPTTDSQGHNILLTDRFRTFAKVLGASYSSDATLSWNVADALNRNPLKQLEAPMLAQAAADPAPPATLELTVGPTMELTVQMRTESDQILEMPSLHLPADVKAELDDTVELFLDPTKAVPVVELLTEELAEIREQLVAASTERTQLSEQVSHLGEALKQKTGADHEYSRRIEAALDDLTARLRASEKERELERREHRRQSDASLREMASMKESIDRLSAGLASDNKDTARQLIEEALDTVGARAAMKVMEEKAAEDARANRTPTVASPISQPIPQVVPQSPIYRMTTDKVSGSSPSGGTATATKTATRPVQTKTRHEIRADQLRTEQPRRQPVRDVHPRAVQPKAGPAKNIFIGLTVTATVMIVATIAVLSNNSMVTFWGFMPHEREVLVSLQEKYLTVTEKLHEKFPSVDLASAAVTAVTHDKNVLYEKASLQNFNAWLSAKGKTDAMQVAADTLEKAGGFRYTKTRTLDPAYGIKKDGAKAHAWQVFLSLLSADLLHGKGSVPRSTNENAFLSLSDWFQGYALPSVRENRPWIFDKIPSLDEQYAIRYKSLLSDPPGPPKNCLLPPAVATLKNRAPASVIKAHTCAVQHLTPALFTSFGKQYTGERELALKHPDRYWKTYCVLPEAINRVHDQVNIPIKELQARACKS